MTQISFINSSGGEYYDTWHGPCHEGASGVGTNLSVTISVRYLALPIPMGYYVSALAAHALSQLKSFNYLGVHHV